MQNDENTCGTIKESLRRLKLKKRLSQCCPSNRTRPDLTYSINYESKLEGNPKSEDFVNIEILCVTSNEQIWQEFSVGELQRLNKITK